MTAALRDLNNRTWAFFYSSIAPNNQQGNSPCPVLTRMGLGLVLSPAVAVTSLLVGIDNVVHAIHNKFFLPPSTIRQEIIGHVIRLSNTKDLISFISHERFIGPDIPPKYQGYKIKGQEGYVLNLIQQGDLSEVLPYLWAEPDADYKIEWLRLQTERLLHPIFFFELSFSLIHEKVVPRKNAEKNALQCLTEALIAFHIGLALVQADTRCVSDPSVAQCVHALAFTYNYGSRCNDEVSQYLSSLEEKVQEERKNAETCAKLESIIERIDTLPSPEWVKEHGLSVFLGGQDDVLKPASEWAQIRRASLQKTIEALRARNAADVVSNDRNE